MRLSLLVWMRVYQDMPPPIMMSETRAIMSFAARDFDMKVRAFVIWDHGPFPSCGYHTPFLPETHQQSSRFLITNRTTGDRCYTFIISLLFRSLAGNPGRNPCKLPFNHRGGNGCRESKRL